MLLTTKDLASLPWGLFSTPADVSALCRTGQLYAFKQKQGQFDVWVIPAESVALWLKSDIVRMASYVSMEVKDVGDDNLRVLKAIGRWLDKNYDDEIYSVQDLSEIFNVPKNQIIVWMEGSSSLKAKILSRWNSRYDIFEVTKMLDANPDRFEMLTDRHKMCLANGDLMESKIRHILMLYVYYKGKDRTQCKS